MSETGTNYPQAVGAWFRRQLRTVAASSYRVRRRVQHYDSTVVRRQCDGSRIASNVSRTASNRSRVQVVADALRFVCVENSQPRPPAAPVEGKPAGAANGSGGAADDRSSSDAADFGEATYTAACEQLHINRVQRVIDGLTTASLILKSSGSSTACPPPHSSSSTAVSDRSVPRLLPPRSL